MGRRPKKIYNGQGGQQIPGQHNGPDVNTAQGSYNINADSQGQFIKPRAISR